MNHEKLIRTLKENRISIGKDVLWLVFALVIIPLIIMSITLGGLHEACQYFLDNFF